MKIARWGNSLAVRLPASVVDALELKEGDEIELDRIEPRTFRVRRQASRVERIARLRELLKGRLPEGYRFDRDDANER